MKEMVGGCCVCSDESGWAENPLVYCDGQGCNVAVHQACYGIISVPIGPWFCRKCESQERAARVVSVDTWIGHACPFVNPILPIGLKIIIIDHSLPEMRTVSNERWSVEEDR